MTLPLVYYTVPFICAGTPFFKTKAKTNKFKCYWVYPFEVWHEFVLKKNNGKKRKKTSGKKKGLEMTSTPLRHALLGVTL